MRHHFIHQYLDVCHCLIQCLIQWAEKHRVLHPHLTGKETEAIQSQAGLYPRPHSQWELNKAGSKPQFTLNHFSILVMAILIFIRSTSNFEHLLCVGLALGAGDTPTDKNTCSHGAESWSMMHGLFWTMSISPAPTSTTLSFLHGLQPWRSSFCTSFQPSSAPAAFPPQGLCTCSSHRLEHFCWPLLPLGFSYNLTSSQLPFPTAPF